jgi:hypothetical protein
LKIYTYFSHGRNIFFFSFCFFPMFLLLTIWLFKTTSILFENFIQRAFFLSFLFLSFPFSFLSFSFLFFFFFFVLLLTIWPSLEKSIIALKVLQKAVNFWLPSKQVNGFLWAQYNICISQYICIFKLKIKNKKNKK